MPTATAKAPKTKTVAIDLARVTRVSTMASKIDASASQAAAEFRRDGAGFEGGAMSGLATGREPSAAERNRMVWLSRLNHKRSGVYGQIVDCLVNFVVGDGPTIACKDPVLDKAIAAVFDDPANLWHRTYRSRMIQLAVDGEYLMSAVVPVRGINPATQEPVPSGSVLFGRMDSDRIRKIEVSRVNVDRLLAVELEGEDGAKEERYNIARPGVQLTPTEDGLVAVFLWRVNTLGRRGVPLLSRSLDKCTMLDAVVEELARKAEYSNRFWVHATYPASGDETKDAKTEANLLAWLRSWTPGEAAATTDGVKVEIHAPDLNLPDAKVLVEVLLEYILGSHGIPRMWYSAGGDTNRATAVEQGTPIHRQIDAIQALAKMDLEDVVRFVIDILKRSGKQFADESFEVTMSDVATRDAMRDVNEISGLVAALDACVASEVISEQERQDVGRTVLKGKSYGERLNDTLKPKILPKVSLAPPPPGSMPGFGAPPVRPEPPIAPAGGNGPAAALPRGA